MCFWTKRKLNRENEEKKSCLSLCFRNIFVKELRDKKKVNKKAIDRAPSIITNSNRKRRRNNWYAFEVDYLNYHQHTFFFLFVYTGTATTKQTTSGKLTKQSENSSLSFEFGLPITAFQEFSKLHYFFICTAPPPVPVLPKKKLEIVFPPSTVWKNCVEILKKFALQVKTKIDFLWCCWSKTNAGKRLHQTKNLPS